MRAMRGSVEGGMCGLMGVPERKKTYKVRRMISLNRGNTQYSIHSNVKLFSKAFITTQVNTCTHAIMPNA